MNKLLIISLLLGVLNGKSITHVVTEAKRFAQEIGLHNTGDYDYLKEEAFK